MIDGILSPQVPTILANLPTPGGKEVEFHEIETGDQK
jgi:hypothetical protein